MPVSKRDVVAMVLRGERPPYVPWHFTFTREAAALLQEHLATDDLDTALDNHFVNLGSDMGFFEDVDKDRVRDVFGVVWDRSVDKDIGIVEGVVLSEPTLAGYTFPNPLDTRFYANIPEILAMWPDRFRVFQIGFSLYERAWTLRGMENLLLDFLEHPTFAHRLLKAITDYNLAQINEALTYDIDAVYLGDDWGQQNGLIMGAAAWREFIYPQLKRMYDRIHAAGKYVMIHSCGKVDELFDDLIDIGLDCFNPFQPEVMDTENLMQAYRGRLAFHGGLSTQQTLPFGSVAAVHEASRQLLTWGAAGGYIFSPAHAVEGDVPLENMLAFIEQARNQNGIQ